MLAEANGGGRGVLGATGRACAELVKAVDEGRVPVGVRQVGGGVAAADAFDVESGQEVVQRLTCVAA